MGNKQLDSKDIEDDIDDLEDEEEEDSDSSIPVAPIVNEQKLPDGYIYKDFLRLNGPGTFFAIRALVLIFLEIILMDQWCRLNLRLRP